MSRVAAHLIVGPREEPFLAALLRSLEDVAQMLIVNDNAPGTSPHAEALAQCGFARRGQLIVDRSPFVSFADARNRVLRLHREHGAGEWAAFVDADEVHAPLAARIASRLDRVPADVGTVDGYTWHFFASFDWYLSIERRMAFFRVNDALRWEGAVHERLAGLEPRRIVLPYVYAHYGHTLEVRRRAEKELHYAELGSPGKGLEGESLEAIDPARYYAREFADLLPFRGEHPEAARETLALLRPRLAALHALADAAAGAQPLPVKLRNALRALNYAQRWRLRALDPLARALVVP